MMPRMRALKASSVVSAMATANPTTRARTAACSSVGRRRTSATPSAAIAPNSGPSTIAPMTRICESTTMAIAAIIVASVMNAR